MTDGPPWIAGVPRYRQWWESAHVSMLPDPAGEWVKLADVIAAAPDFDGLIALLRAFEPAVSSRIPPPQEVLQKIRALQAAVIRAAQQDALGIRRADLDRVEAMIKSHVEAIASYVEHLRDEYVSTTEPVSKVARLIRERFGQKAEGVISDAD